MEKSRTTTPEPLSNKRKVGGIIYYNWANGLHSPEQIQALSQGLQTLADTNQHPIPLLIAVDQEGGVCARFTKGFTIFPGNKALGMTANTALAEAAAYAIGEELKAVGVNMNLAPVVDVNTNPRNPIIGVRAFGDNPDIVAEYGQKALDGYRQSHIIATLKHYPGHGDVEIDSHEEMPVVRKSLDNLQANELVPFAKLAPNADAIMTAHILVPALDPDYCSTLSKKTLGYLRDTIGFNGVIISDSLVMDGVLKKCETVDEAAIQALNAGCDVLLLGGKLFQGALTGFELSVADVRRIHASIVAAVKSGRVDTARLDEAVARILQLKERYLTQSSMPSDLSRSVKTADHQALVKKIATIALRTQENSTENIFPLCQKKIALLAPTILSEPIADTTLLTLGATTDAHFFGSLNLLEDEVNQAKLRAAQADLVIVCSYNAWKNPGQVSLIQVLIDTGKPLIVIATRDPLDASLFPKAKLVFTTYSPTSVSIQAVCDQLAQE